MIEPITFNDQSSTYIVWSTARDISNIVFIIFILVVIFSQLTGLGFDNYNIKKTLPRIIIAAVLVNLSFLICSLAVDTSNIIGASLKGFFDHITLTVQQNSASQVSELSWSTIIGQIIGTAGTLAGTSAIIAAAVSMAGGLQFVIWPIIFAVISAIISLAIGLLTISLRQAVVTILIMIAPLAFVAYLLPNTEQYFKKWKDTLLQMLIFYPMFATLYGASNLLGWTFITSGADGKDIFKIIIGMALQVVPLVVSFKMLQMSNTILGKVSETLNNLSQPIRSFTKDFTDTQAATAKAKYDADSMSRRYTGIGRLNPRNFRSFYARRQAEMTENRRLAEARREDILKAYNAARQINKEVEFDKNGRITLSKETRTNGMTTSMDLAVKAKEASLNLSGIELERDNAISQPRSYLRDNNIRSAELENIIARQRDNWLDYKTQANAKRRNDLSDEQFYASEVLRASKQSHDSEDYQRLIVRGGGVNALDANKTIQGSALASVISGAYDLTEAERQSDINRLTTFFATQATENVEAELNNAIKNNDVNSIIAALNTLDARGDGDKVTRYVRDFMDSGQLHVATEYANNLAKTMLAYGTNPLVKGVGKFINVETLAYTEGRRQDDTITFKEFITGAADFDNIELDANGNPRAYTPKYDVISTIRGKDFSGANRTTMKAIMEAMMAYQDDDTVSNDMMEERILELDNQIRPQLVTAIPTYNSGSEEIYGAIRYLTGYVSDGNGGWKFDGTVEGADGQKIQLSQDFYHKRTRSYLSAFTPGDLVKFKSDVLAATKQLFADVNGNDAAAAKAEFQQIFSRKDIDPATGVNRGGNDAIATLLAGDLNRLGDMKEALRDILDLDSQHLPETLAKYGYENKLK